MKQTQIDQINNDIKASGLSRLFISKQLGNNRNAVYNFLKAKKMNVETLKGIYKIIGGNFKDLI